MIWAALLETVINHLRYADELGVLFLFLSFIVSLQSACQLFVSSGVPACEVRLRHLM